MSDREVFSPKWRVMFKCAELCLAVGGFEVVMVYGYVAEKAYCPSLVWLVGEKTLVVEVVGFIFSFRLQRAEHIAVGLIAHAVAP